MQVQASTANRGYTWADGKENDYASGGNVEETTLPGIEADADKLRANNIYVKGKEAYIPGKRPDDAHTTKTENHDSFDQTAAYVYYNQLRSAWENADLGMTFAEMVKAKSGRSEMVATVNGTSDLNAFYAPWSEAQTFGTANGEWDLGSDGDVVVHEAGHFVLDHLAPGISRGTGGAMHEAFGDSQSSFLFRDPELSEDFGVIRNQPAGEGLRNVYNNHTVSSTSSSPHDRGRVYSGFMWSVGEFMHEIITGTKRDPAIDAEPLNGDAADLGLKILWTYPLHLGTRRPGSDDFVRSVLESVDTLVQAGKWDNRIDPEALKAFMLEEAGRRELDTGADTHAPTALSSTSTAGAVREALQQAGGTSSAFSVRFANDVTLPNGDQVMRFEVIREVEVAGEFQPVLVDDDYLTVIKKADGTFAAQTGTLPEALAAANVSNGGPTLGRSTPRVDEETHSAWFQSLTAQAASELQTRATFAPEHDEHGHDHAPASIAEGALRAISSGEDVERKLVWRDGRLMAYMRAGGESFVADVNDDGTLGEMTRETLIFWD